MRSRTRELEMVDVDVRTSTLEARQLFMNLIFQERPECAKDLLRLFNPEYLPVRWQRLERPDLVASEFVTSRLGDVRLIEREVAQLEIDPKLFDTPTFNLSKFLTQESTEFGRLLGILAGMSAEATETALLYWAIEKLLGDLDHLREQTAAKDLYRSVVDWSVKWNLRDRWCLEFAMDALVDFRVEIERFIRGTICEVDVEYLIGPTCPIQYWTSNAWHSAIRDLRKRSSVSSQIAISRADDSTPIFRFQRRDGEIVLFDLIGTWSPFYESLTDFKRRVESQLLDQLHQYLGANIEGMAGRIDELDQHFRDFIFQLSSFCRCVMKTHERTAQRVPFKPSGDLHFRWLIEYQFSRESCEAISERAGVGRKTVEDGIKDAARLLGLTRRTPRRGRPRGVPEKSIHRGVNKVK